MFPLGSEFDFISKSARMSSCSPACQEILLKMMMEENLIVLLPKSSAASWNCATWWHVNLNPCNSLAHVSRLLRLHTVTVAAVSGSVCTWLIQLHLALAN